METKYKETEIGLIPEDWYVKKLSQIAEFSYGKFIPKKELYEEGYPVYSGYTIVGHLPRFKYKDSKLLIVCRGVGGTGDIKLSPPNCTITNLSIIFDLDASVDKNFLYWKLKSMDTYSLRTGSAQPQITIKDLNNFNVSFPLLNEQKNIAKILSDFDAKIQINNQMNHTLEAIGQAIFRYWFVHFEFPDENGQPYKSSGGEMVDSELGEIPLGWEVGKLGDLCSSITNGGTPKRKEPKFWENGTIPWFKTGELCDGFLIDSEEYINETGLKNSSCKLWEPNTVLIALYGVTVGQLGILTTFATANQACSGLIAKKEVGYQYLFYNLLLKKSQLISSAIGSAQQNISQDIVKNTETIIPSSKLTINFQKIVEPLFKMKIELLNESNHLYKIRDSLLPKLMSGKIRVKPQQEAAVK